MTITTAARPAELARRLVRHFGANFPQLESMFPGVFPRLIVSGSGSFLTDEDGHRVLDAGNHLGVCVVGHSRADMAAAISAQVLTLEFASLDAGASHPYVAELAQALAERVPVQDPFFSFTVSGSEANELAIKIARDYFGRRGEPQRTKIVTRTGSYHGSSYGAMTATGIPGFRDAFKPLVPDFVNVPQPFPGHCGSCPAAGSCVGTCLDETAAIIEREGPETIAAILAEPISIPGAIKVPSDDYWPKLRELCDEHGILLIADEVVCGFGRTGRWFGVEHWSVQADMVTMAKGLTSGYVPFGAVAVSGSIQEAFEDTPLSHLNTYAGHPVACAAAMQTLKIIEDEGLVERAAANEGLLSRGLRRTAALLPWHSQVSVRGLLGSVEIHLPLDIDPELFRTSLWNSCYEEGVLLRVTRSAHVVSIIFYPPLTVEVDDLGEGLEALGRAVNSTLVALTPQSLTGGL